ncbi:MAG TPA: efflux RND transporter periplasmic adaptor subunit [Xanthobacteraceae bacterium]|nr:efflux RND transporter periplasmic adaptor subunit [Xanthobacteraceae bacterium]
MLTRNRKILLLTGVLLTGVAATIPEFAPRFRAVEPASAQTDSASWAAVAPGRVEPRSREIKIGTPLPARVVDVPVKANDEVFAGELLVRLDDEEALARLAAADAQVALRKRARNDQATPAASADRRKAEDAAFDSERAVGDAQSALDKVAADRRAAGNASQADLDAARAALTRAKDQLRTRHDTLAKAKAPDSALPSRLEGELNVARAEWTLAMAALEKSRIRAPADSTVLQVDAKKGELAMPTSEQALMVLGDVSALRVRAELDEQYLGKVRAGQRVLVRAAAFRGREFEGKISAVARIVGPGRINARGPRKFSDVDVLEVVVDLSDPGPLVVGEQVDVYFSPDASEQAQTQSQ